MKIGKGIFSKWILRILNRKSLKSILFNVLTIHVNNFHIFNTFSCAISPFHLLFVIEIKIRTEERLRIRLFDPND